jgi:hypothetical protein
MHTERAAEPFDIDVHGNQAIPQLTRTYYVGCFKLKWGIKIKREESEVGKTQVREEVPVALVKRDN